MRMKNKPKMKPTVELLIKHECWDDVRKMIKLLNIRHSPFVRTYKGFSLKLEASENQILMLQMNGNINIVKYLQQTVAS